MPERKTSSSARAIGGVRRALCAGVFSALASVLWVTIALADATPVQLVLLYMPNVSTNGSTTASGIAELLLPEGEVRINAADMIHLDGDMRYVAWVINTATSEFLRLGAFNTAPNGTVRFETVLPDAIPNRHWNLLLVTVEKTAEPARPGPEHSIAGVFPRADNAPLPSVLPNTGGATSEAFGSSSGSNWPLMTGLAALTLSIGFGAGYATRGRTSVRSATPSIPKIEVRTR